VRAIALRAVSRHIFNHHLTPVRFPFAPYPPLGTLFSIQGYGLAKAASHHFVRTLGASTGNSLEPKSVRKAGRRVRKRSSTSNIDDATVVGVLPSVIDTAANRKSMPDANFDQWVKPIDIAKEIGRWLDEPSLRPHSGSLVKVYPGKKRDKDKAGADGSSRGGAVFELVR